MAFIRVKEIFPNNHSVKIHVDGILDRDSLPILKDVCTHHLQLKREIWLDLDGVTRISREARDFLREIRSKILGLTISANFDLVIQNWGPKV
jgi:hypothetical protein